MWPGLGPDPEFYGSVCFLMGLGEEDEWLVGVDIPSFLSFVPSF